MRKDSQRSCVKRSCIQDIGWQIGFRWRGGRHLLCIPTPLYRNNIQLLLPAFTNGASRALRKINIFHLSLQVLSVTLLFCNISYSHPLILSYSFFTSFFTTMELKMDCVLFWNRLMVLRLVQNLPGLWSPCPAGFVKMKLMNPKS